METVILQGFLFIKVIQFLEENSYNFDGESKQDVDQIVVKLQRKTQDASERKIYENNLFDWVERHIV